MENYTIYCTKEQTRKALELGAPIKSNIYTDFKGELEPLGNNKYGIIPTAEQMIGWLEAQTGINDISIYKTELGWCYNIYNFYSLIEGGRNMSSRKEATIEAIDVALEYIKKMNNKKII